MYRCDNCNCNCDHSEIRATSKVREVEYQRFFNTKREGNSEQVFDQAFKGQEIVQEKRVCKSCALQIGTPKLEGQKVVKFLAKRIRKPVTETNSAIPAEINLEAEEAAIRADESFESTGS